MRVGRDRRSVWAAVAERILTSIGFELDLSLRLTFRVLDNENGRLFRLPDQLWRLEPSEIFKPLRMTARTGRKTFYTDNRRDRVAGYTVLLRYGTQPRLITHLDAALLLTELGLTVDEIHDILRRRH